MIYREKSKYQEIIIGENECFGKMLILDKEIQFAERDEYIFHEMMVYPALSLAKGEGKEEIKTLILGGGDGLAAKRVLSLNSIPTIVELDERVVELSKKYFESLGAKEALERSNLVIGDALKFSAEKKYDVVIVDLIDFYSEQSLYSKQALERFSSFGELVVLHGDAKVYKEIEEQVEKVFNYHLSFAAFIPSFFSLWTFIIASNNEININKIRDSPFKGRWFSKEHVWEYKGIEGLKLYNYNIEVEE